MNSAFWIKGWEGSVSSGGNWRRGSDVKVNLYVSSVVRTIAGLDHVFEIATNGSIFYFEPAQPGWFWDNALT